MASRKKKQAEPWLERRGVRMAGFVLIGMLAAGLLGGAGYGVWTVDSKARVLLAEEKQRVVIEWPTSVDPVSGEARYLHDVSIRGEVQAQVEAMVQHEPEPFEPAVLEQVGEWLAGSGWFDGEPTIRRQDATTMRVEGAWRRPVALVRYGRGELARDYLVDHELKLLPKIYAVGERQARYLTGATHAPAGNAPWSPNYETPWPDKSLEAGLELLMLLSRQPYAGQVAGVDVRDYFVENRLTIITERGSRVVWGGPVGEFIPGEADTQQKLTHLLQFYNDPAYGRRIDAGLDRLEIFDRQVVIDRTGRR